MARVRLIAAVSAVAVVGVVATVAVVGEVVLGSAEQAAAGLYVNTSCDASLGPFQGVSASQGASAAAHLTAEQRANAALIISIGKKRNLPPLAWQIAIQAGMQESGLRNIDYGDAAGPDSRGIFQMRPSQGWGSPAQVMDPTYEVNKFYDVLTSVPNWQQQRPGASAQAVERSAFPLAYNKWESLAAFLVQQVGQVIDPTGCGPGLGDLLPAPTQAAATAIAFALAQIGKPYLWGGTGPNAFDCSGLVMRAYQAAGVNLPRTAAEQYHAGALLPVRDAQPGDLMFLAYDPHNPDTIHHVFMYLGNNQMVEAPFENHPVHQTAVPWTDPELVAQAVRPGV